MYTYPSQLRDSWAQAMRRQSEILKAEQADRQAAKARTAKLQPCTVASASNAMALQSPADRGRSGVAGLMTSIAECELESLTKAGDLMNLQGLATAVRIASRQALIATSQMSNRRSLAAWPGPARAR